MVHSKFIKTLLGLIYRFYEQAHREKLTFSFLILQKSISEENNMQKMLLVANSRCYSNIQTAQ